MVLQDVIRPGTTRGLDFVNLEELRKRTGINAESILKFACAEILCNALDTDASEISITMQQRDVDFDTLTVSDNGSKKLSLNDIKLILDFDNKASSKRGLLRVSRGYLGNALKCIFGYSYALAESKALVPPEITIASGQSEFHISLKPNIIKQIIESEVSNSSREDDGCTSLTVKFPANLDVNIQALKDLVFATSMVNPNRKISYNLFGEDQGTLGFNDGEQQIRMETSTLWYNPKQFQTLYDDFVRAAPETPIKDFIALFRGLTAKNVIREILQELNAQNHDSETNGSVQFFPATPIKELTPRVSALFAIMKTHSKPIEKRSIPAVLGMVGEANLEKIRQQNGWQRLRYVIMKAEKIECSKSFYCCAKNCESCKEEHTKFPYLIELAVFDRDESDTEGLKVYQCVNFMASMEDIFSRIFDVKYRLGLVGIKGDMPVTVLLHLVCPVLNWLNYGKSGLGE